MLIEMRLIDDEWHLFKNKVDCGTFKKLEEAAKAIDRMHSEEENE
jgi:hypothetical protein